MKLSELKSLLQAGQDKSVRVALPDGEVVPSHFHVTEVGHIRKDFIDCGGTRRSVSLVQLQLWLGSDEGHRLTAGKLARILELARDIVPSDDLEVEVEYEGCSISQFPIQAAVVDGSEIRIELTTKHTDCLAKAACEVDEAGAATGCCGGGIRL